jgi:hypothetical protein
MTGIRAAALRLIGTLMLATLFGAALTLLAADAACVRLRRRAR